MRRLLCLGLTSVLVSSCSMVPGHKYQAPVGPSAQLTLSTSSPVETQIHLLGDSMCHGAKNWYTFAGSHQETISMSSHGTIHLMLTGIRVSPPSSVQNCSVIVAMELEADQSYELEYRFDKGPCDVALYQIDGLDRIDMKVTTPSSIMNSRQCTKLAESVRLDRQKLSRLLP